MTGAGLRAWPAVALLLMLASPGRGQEADSTTAANNAPEATPATGAGAPVASAAAEEAFPDPGTALLAGLLPGGGQIYNGKWLKAALFVGVEAYYFSRWQESREFFVNYDDYELPFSRNKYLENRNKFAWWIAAYYIMGMLDAYVDAHLAPFPPDTASVRPQKLPSPIEEKP